MTKDLACLWGAVEKAMSKGAEGGGASPPHLGRLMLCTQSRELCNHVWLQALALSVEKPCQTSVTSRKWLLDGQTAGRIACVTAWLCIQNYRRGWQLSPLEKWFFIYSCLGLLLLAHLFFP